MILSNLISKGPGDAFPFPALAPWAAHKAPPEPRASARIGARPLPDSTPGPRTGPRRRGKRREQGPRPHYQLLPQIRFLCPHRSLGAPDSPPSNILAARTRARFPPQSSLIWKGAQRRAGRHPSSRGVCSPPL